VKISSCFVISYSYQLKLNYVCLSTEYILYLSYHCPILISYECHEMMRILNTVVWPLPKLRQMCNRYKFELALAQDELIHLLTNAFEQSRNCFRQNIYRYLSTFVGRFCNFVQKHLLKGVYACRKDGKYLTSVLLVVPTDLGLSSDS